MEQEFVELNSIELYIYFLKADSYSSCIAAFLADLFNRSQLAAVEANTPVI